MVKIIFQLCCLLSTSAVLIQENFALDGKDIPATEPGRNSLQIGNEVTTSVKKPGGRGVKIMDFLIQESASDGDDVRAVSVFLNSGSASLARCKDLESYPSYDQPYALLMAIDKEKMEKVNFQDLGQYIRNQKPGGPYAIKNIAYYLPVVNQKTGQLGELCQNETAAASKVTQLQLAPGWYRVALSSYKDFFSVVNLYYQPNNGDRMIHISASDYEEMKDKFHN